MEGQTGPLWFFPCDVKYKWRNIYKYEMNTKWNDRPYILKIFIGIHWTSYVQLKEAAEHVNFQLPTKYNFFRYLLDNIHNNDPDLCAVLVSGYNNLNGIRNNFELEVLLILPINPYDKHHSEKNPHKPQISKNTLKGVGHSRTDVYLKWQTKSEYDQLNK